MKHIAIIMAIISECACAQADYFNVLTNMVSALERPAGTLGAEFTNQLAESALEITNDLHITNINLVHAMALADIAEEALSGDSILPQAITMCSNILTSASLSENAWQRGAAGIVLSGIYSFDGNRAEACCAVTNSTVTRACSISREDDIYLWRAVAKHLSVEGVTVQDAIRTYSAISIIGKDSASNISSYTNGLPSSLIEKIQELSE